MSQNIISSLIPYIETISKDINSMLILAAAGTATAYLMK